MSVKFGTGECKPMQAGQNEAKQQVDSWGQAKNKTKKTTLNVMVLLVQDMHQGRLARPEWDWIPQCNV